MIHHMHASCLPPSSSFGMPQGSLFRSAQTLHWRQQCHSKAKGDQAKRGSVWIDVRKRILERATTGRSASSAKAAQQHSVTNSQAPVVPEQYSGAAQAAYLAGYKVCA